MSEELAHVELILEKFVDSPTGVTEYPFQINLPKGLPPSVLVKTPQIEGLKATHQYFVCA